MVQSAILESAVDAKQALAGADQRLAMCVALLERHAALGPSRLLDDEIVARVRALATDLARQLAGDDIQLIDPVRDMLLGRRAILLHLAAAAIESRLTCVLSTRRALDAVLPPLVQQRLGLAAGEHHDQSVPAALVAAQTRLGQSLRQMRLPLDELPNDLQQLAYAILDVTRVEHGLVERAARPVGHPEHDTRLALLRQFLASLGDDGASALQLDQAGLSLFLTALAMTTGQPRELVALAIIEDDAIRLALLLRAAGLHPDQAAVQLLALRPDADPALIAVADHEQLASALLNGHPA